MRVDRRFVAILLISGFVGCLFPRATRANDKASKDAVVQMLKIGWGKSFRVLQPAQEHYQRARKIAPSDPLPSYAFALVNVKHRKYAQAKKLLEEAISLDDGHLPSRQANIWIDVLLKRYEAALVQAEQLSRLLPKNEMEGEADARQFAAARFLGRVYGYLAGPVRKAAGEQRVADSKSRVLERLSMGRRQAFETARGAVADRFAELFLVRDQSKEEAQTIQQETKQRDAKRLEQDRDSLDAQKQVVQQQALESRQALDRLLSDLEKKLAPLDRQLGQLKAQAVVLRGRMLEVDREIGRLLTLAEITKDPGLRLRYRVEADRFNILHARYATDYRRLEAAASVVSAQRSGLLGQRVAAIRRFNAEAKRLGREQVKLNRSDQQVSKKQAKNRRPPSGNTPKVRALSQKVTAFTTYVPFPLEEAKAWVLHSLR